VHAPCGFVQNRARRPRGGGLVFVLAACGGSPKNAVASVGNGKSTTTAQSSGPAPQSPGGGGQAVSAGGGGGTPSGPGLFHVMTGGSYTQALKFADCMRTHGLPDFPGPSSNGTFQISASSAAAPGSPQFQAAEPACRKFMPNGGGPPSPAQQAKMLAHMLKFSECMRSHGIVWAKGRSPTKWAEMVDGFGQRSARSGDACTDTPSGQLISGA
jgi:hypothetical protein